MMKGDFDEDELDGADGPRCPVCGCDLETEEHDHDCYDGDEDEDLNADE